MPWGYYATDETRQLNGLHQLVEGRQAGASVRAGHSPQEVTVGRFCGLGSVAAPAKHYSRQYHFFQNT